jgi:hypothetical protein
MPKYAMTVQEEWHIPETKEQLSEHSPLRYFHQPDTMSVSCFTYLNPLVPTAEVTLQS